MFGWLKRIRKALSKDHYAEGREPRVGFRIDGTPFAAAKGELPRGSEGGKGAVARTGGSRGTDR